MRVLTFALCVSVFALTMSPSAFADDRTADYGSTPARANTVIEKRMSPTGDTQLKASDESELNPVEQVREGFSYGTSEELNEASKAAVLDGQSVTTRTTEERRDSVPRVQELGF